MDSLIEDDAPAGNTPEFSVSELSGAVKRTIEGEFGHVRVRGELGRVSRPRSGHVYVDLKDDRAVIAGVIWKGVAARLDMQPEEGLEVVATGRLTTFPGQSKYQIVIEQMVPAGAGALMATLERRRKALAAEGLFDAERKRALPYLPRIVGVVTSPSGAVIRDILHRLADRFPVHVLVWPVAVQGDRCAPEVAAAIAGFSAMDPARRPDVVIVARGGGAVEDLWGFNEEIVVRAAATSAVPLISAVGHETDTTLIDHAADRRAPTPTAAAEMAVPVRAELLATVADLDARRLRAAAQIFERRRQRLIDLARALPRPEQILAERRQRLDLATARLPHPGALIETSRQRLALITRGLAPALRNLTQRARIDLSGHAARLTPGLVTQRIGRGADRLEAAVSRLAPALGRSTQRARDRCEALRRTLEAYSYQRTLARGFVVMRDRDGAVVANAASVEPGMPLEAQFADARRQMVAAGAAPKPRSRTRKAPEEDQGKLFE